MDGKIYIAGGDYGSDGSTPPAFDGLFIYDVATDTWSEGATMPAGRGGLAVVCDEPHHKLYAVGGWPWTDVGHWYMGSDDLWSYDAGTDTWDDTLSRHPLPVAMTTASMVEDGMFLVAGGHIGEQEPSVRTFTYTIATDTWEESGELSDTRFEHAAVLLQPDRMCLLGGTTPDYYTLASWECWRDGVWTPMPTDMPEPRYVFAAGSVGETTYVMGGFTSHAWDPARTHTTSVQRYPSSPLPDTGTDAPGDAPADSADDVPADVPEDLPSDTSTDAPEDTGTDTGDGPGDDGGCSCSMAR